MEESNLRTIYKEYFQNKIQQSQKYKKLFSKAVHYEKEYLSTHKNDTEKLEQIIDAFTYSQTQMLEDTFVSAVKYAYDVFNKIRYSPIG